MSPLPDRRKTPEELAALRESLGISPDGPPPGAPGALDSPAEVAVTEEAVVPERDSAPPPSKAELPKGGIPFGRTKPAPEPEPAIPTEEVIPLPTDDEVVALEALEEPAVELEPEAGPKPVRSLRKSERLPVDKPKKRISRGSGELPVKRHSDQELARLRHQQSSPAVPPAVQIEALGAGGTTLAGIYGLGLILMMAARVGVSARKVPSMDLPFDWLRDAVALPNYNTILFGIMAGGVATLLLGATWIFFKKPRSQHHSALMTIIAVLVLVFGTLYLFPELHGA